MNKVRLLTIALVVLLLLNMGLVAKLFMGERGQHGPPKHEGPKSLIIERLHLDAEQVKAYEVLISSHQEIIGQKEHEMMATRKLLYDNLLQANTPAPDSLTQAVGAIRSAIEQAHYDHFAAIRALCRPDQIKAYDDLVIDLADLFGRPGMKAKR